MELVDREIPCLDCGGAFVFTAGEQEFYERKGFREEPKRCKPCRDARKLRRNAQLVEGVAHGSPTPARAAAAGRVVDEDDADSIGNRAPREARPVRAGGGRELFDAVCARCGAPTRVPFRPVAGRPVYCRECYGARAGGAP